MELQSHGPLEGTGMGLEVAPALLSLYSLPHSVSVSRTGNRDWALETRFIHETTQLPSLGQSFFEG